MANDCSGEKIQPEVLMKHDLQNQEKPKNSTCCNSRPIKILTKEKPKTLSSEDPIHSAKVERNLSTGKGSF